MYISCKKTDIARTICLLLKSNILMETTSVTAEYAAQWQYTGTGRCTQSYELHPAAEMMQDPGFSENANTKPDNMIKCKCWPTVNSQCSFRAIIRCPDNLKIFFAGIPQGPLETSPGTIKKFQRRFQVPPARGF